MLVLYRIGRLTACAAVSRAESLLTALEKVTSNENILIFISLSPTLNPLNETAPELVPRFMKWYEIAAAALMNSLRYFVAHRGRSVRVNALRILRYYLVSEPLVREFHNMNMDVLVAR